MNSIIDALFGVAKLIKSRIGQSHKDWLVWANENPGPASLQLSLLGRQLEARAKSRKRQKGMIARRERELSKAMFQQSADLRARAHGQECPRNPFRRPGSN